MSRIKCRVLCVDDHHDTSEMLQLLLSQEDYEVVTAAGVEDFRKARPECRIGWFGKGS